MIPVGVAVLGATGSIGQSTLDVIRHFSERFRVVALAAGNNLAVLDPLVREFRPDLVALYNPVAAAKLSQQLDRVILCGDEGMSACASHPDVDVVVAGISGAAGLKSTFAAASAGKTIALANKESMVMAGNLLKTRAHASGSTIIPVDSEHSAIYQCLAGNSHNRVARIILTASGGPFFGKNKETLRHVTTKEALNHPTWRMGRKITIDSATLMNKALELIEAHVLFDIAPELIDVVVHKQSLVHSLVEFSDGQMLAQLSYPDMRGPIAYALTRGERLSFSQHALNIRPLDLLTMSPLTFEPVDTSTFPAPRLARRALQQGHKAVVTLNATNEVAVENFLSGRMAFLDIAEIIEKSLNLCGTSQPLLGIEDILEIDRQARAQAQSLIDEVENR